MLEVNLKEAWWDTVGMAGMVDEVEEVVTTMRDYPWLHVPQMPPVSFIHLEWDKYDRIKDRIAAVTTPSGWVAVTTFTIGTKHQEKKKNRGHDKITEDLINEERKLN